MPGGDQMPRLNHSKRALLRALVKRIDPITLTKAELLLLVDLLNSALAVADAPPDLGEEFISR
jgi:hypothetical protein